MPTGYGWVVVVDVAMLCLDAVWLNLATSHLYRPQAGLSFTKGGALIRYERQA